MADEYVVSAPASSGNLGPGFDCLGLAVQLRNELTLREGSGAITVEGEGAGVLPQGSENLVARAFERVAPAARGAWDLHCVNRIPLARGLGSSTAAAALGLAAGMLVADGMVDHDRLFELLCELDGHPDNAGPCVFGGVAFTQPYLMVLEAPEWLAPLFVVPEREVSTASARAALPGSYAREDVVRALGAAATLGAGLALDDDEAVAAVLELDVVHERQRAELVPELAAVRGVAREAGALGATLSGAGPSVLVWCTYDTRDEVEAALEDALPDLSLRALDPDESGIEIAAAADA